MQQTHRQITRSLIASIQPLDTLEKAHQIDALNWIDSGAPICRTAKPATPPKHLVAYSVLVDLNTGGLLLGDHKQAHLWLPTGGHVEPDEHPSETAQRELTEELGIQLPLLQPEPLFLTITETVGTTAGHTDVSLWYLFTADSLKRYTFDRTEFCDIRWFSLNNLPLERTDPHLARFCSKLLALLSIAEV